MKSPIFVADNCMWHSIHTMDMNIKYSVYKKQQLCHSDSYDIHKEKKQYLGCGFELWNIFFVVFYSRLNDGAYQTYDFVFYIVNNQMFVFAEAN